MSHNVSMSGIPVSDFKTLDMALAELNKEYGTDMKLERGAVESRNYSGYGGPGRTVLPNTIGVIKCKGMDYDITITKDKDGKVSMQTESLMINPLIEKFDRLGKMHNLLQKNEIDTKDVGYGRNESLGMAAALGPIVQRYALITAEKQAAMAGQRCRRVNDKKTGVMSLVVTA